MVSSRDNQESISLYDRPRTRNSHSSDADVSQAKMDLGQHPQLDRTRGWFKTLLFQTGCFLWILPVVALLTLNIKKHIVGASAWCPDQNCYVGWFNPVISIPQANLRHFDKQDHNLLGALQFAAKAIEIWFELIALALVYLITFHIAGKSDGLPIGFITRPCEFADVPGLFDPLLWRTLPPTGIFNRRNRGGSRKFRLRIYLFIGFTVLLCILCNLMGPAVAVLALPSLQWIETPKLGHRSFGSTNAASPPVPNTTGYFWNMTVNCTETHFNDLAFSCAANPYATLFDSWMESYLASGAWADGTTREQGVKFNLNQTFSTSSAEFVSQEFSDITWWAPSRQLMFDLNNDFTMIGVISLGANKTLQDRLYDAYVGIMDRPETYYPYNRSLLLNVQRNGPILGAIVQWHADFNNTASSVTVVDDNRSIRCYQGYDLSMSPLSAPLISGVYTKCIRTGNGWSPTNKEVGFTISGERDYTTDIVSPDVRFSMFTSDKAQFFESNTIPSWLPPECLQEGPVPSSVECDWDRLFEVDPSSSLLNRTENVFTTEMSIGSNSQNDTTLKLTVDFVAFQNFTTYQLDPSPLTNPTTLVQTHNLPHTGNSTPIDPAWMLAAWTANNNGTLAPNRTSTMQAVRTMNRLRLNDTIGLDYPLGYVSLLPIIQTLSLVDYTTQDDGVDNSDHPKLTRNAKMYVWAYGLGSRTSKLGLAVASFGIVVVLIQVVLGFVDRRKYRSPTQLLVAALEHVPAGEFRGIEHNEAKVAKMRFRVQGTAASAGRYSFSMHGHRV